MGWLFEAFDVPVLPEKRRILIEAFDKAGGIASLQEKMAASRSLGIVARLMFGMPEFQMC